MGNRSTGRHRGQAGEARPTAVLFDLDGTLVLTAGGVECVWVEWARRHGLDPGTVLDRIHGRHTEGVLRELRPGHDAARRADRLEAEIVRTARARPVEAMSRLYRELSDDRRAIVTSARRRGLLVRRPAAGAGRRRRRRG